MKWRKRMAVTGAALMLYILSSGPAVRLAQIKDTRGSAPLEKVVGVLYFPLGLAAVICPAFDSFLDWYVQLWGGPPEVGPWNPGPSAG